MKSVLWTTLLFFVVRTTMGQELNVNMAEFWKTIPGAQLHDIHSA
jgi:hypothetical protein